MRNTMVTVKLTMQPVRQFSYELGSRLQVNRQVNQSDKSLSGDRIRTFNHTLSVFLFPFSGFQVGLKGEVYHSSDKSVSANLFADAHCSWQFKRYELRLQCNNIFGNHRYERRLRTSVTDVYSVYRLRPREVLLAFSVEF